MKRSTLISDANVLVQAALVDVPDRKTLEDSSQESSVVPNVALVALCDVTSQLHAVFHV